MASKQQVARKPSVVRRQDRPILVRIALQFGDALLALGLLAVIAFCGFMAYKRITQNAFFPLKRVVLERPLIYADAQSITNAVRDYGRADLLQVQPNELAAQIRKMDWVQAAMVAKQWPDALRINVLERVPILRWGDDDFLDNDANHFHLPETPALSQLFPVRGPEGTENTVLAMYRKINPWLNAQGIRITGITLDPRMNWHVMLPGEINVVVGRDELNKRFKKLIPVYERIIKKYNKYIESVDLRYQDGFSVRWKNGVSPADPEVDKNTTKAKKL